MNIGVRLAQRQYIIPLFTWTWIIGSTIASSYFAFVLFDRLISPKLRVNVLFKRNNQQKDGVTYELNSDQNRKMYRDLIADKNNLYFTGCEAVPLSQQPNCDVKANWQKVDPSAVGCSDVMNCAATTVVLTDSARQGALADIQPLKDHAFTISDVRPTLSDPATWGPAGKWPVFFVSLFLAIKLGRAIGEFGFTPYTKG